MKVLLINKFLYQRGGSEMYNFALAEALKKRGHEVIFFAMQDDKNIDTRFSKYFVSNVDYNGKQDILDKIAALKKFFYSEEAALKIEELILNEHPDIAHIGLIHRQITFSVVKVLKKYNIPIVMTMHDLIFVCPNYMMLNSRGTCNKCVNGSVFNCVKYKCVKNSFSKSILAALEKKYLIQKKYYDYVDLYIAECETYKELFVKSKVTTSKIICKTNFLPVDQKFGFACDYEEYILFFGRFSIEKGIMTMLKAHKKMNCKYQLVIVGTGPIENDIMDYVKNNNIKNVEFPGPVYGEEMEKIIEHAKVIIIPSEWYENCPYALLQSIAKGKIVVASRIGGLPELIEDGKTGYLFTAGDAEDLMHKINTVMDMGEKEYVEMSKKIAALAKEKHGWEQYTDFIIEAYQALIEKNNQSQNNYNMPLTDMCNFS